MGHSATSRLHPGLLLTPDLKTFISGYRGGCIQSFYDSLFVGHLLQQCLHFKDAAEALVAEHERKIMLTGSLLVRKHRCAHSWLLNDCRVAGPLSATFSRRPICTS